MPVGVGFSGLFGVFGAGGFAQGRQLRVEELGGETAGEGFDGFALFRRERREFRLGTLQFCFA